MITTALVIFALFLTIPLITESEQDKKLSAPALALARLLFILILSYTCFCIVYLNS